jgi:diaminohydroxyphosphoribosylaminopyrimidine deaminase/5-amino-6-(5-phosphoribosylamino)uracil reductase
MEELFMQRCFDLARIGANAVQPNPMVGAVLVHEGRIIGEGFHARYGQAHAEVNTLRSVKPEDRHLIPHSTLFVSLEPCCIFGNTPPCTNLIIEHKIPRVVISVLDQTAEVHGKGVEILRRAGVEVRTGILPKGGAEIASIRNTFVSQERPFIILKYAQSKDGFFAPREHRQVWLSNPLSKRLVHRWRSESSAILVGQSTALIDNPRLSNRLYYGPSPVRLTIDRTGRLPADLHLFNGRHKTLVFTERQKASPDANLEFLPIDFSQPIIPQILAILFKRRISSLFVEGGAQTIQGFIDANSWDRALILTGAKPLGDGILAPRPGGILRGEYRIDTDQLLVLDRSEGKNTVRE